MSLTLRVQSYRKQAPAMPVERRFDQLGGTIGRAAGNDLELPDPGKYISRNHSKIDFADGRYTLMDLGANPSWINDRPVGTGKVASLEHGDRLMIGDYVLEVLVEQPTPGAVPVFSTESSEALPFQAQPSSPPSPADAPQYEPMADTLSGMKVLDVAAHFDPLAAPSANDPLGLNLHDNGAPAPTLQQPAAYRGSEADHVAPQFIPMPGSLLPGQQPAIAVPEIAQPYHAQQQAYAPQPQAVWPAPFPSAGGIQQASPYAPEPTVLVVRTPTAAPTAPPAPAMLIPDDYDPLADLLPQRAPPPAVVAGVVPGVVPGVTGTHAGWPAHGIQPQVQQMQQIAPLQAMPPAASCPAQSQAQLQPRFPSHPQSHPQSYPQPAAQAMHPGWPPAAPGPQAYPGAAPAYPYPNAVQAVPPPGQGDAILQALLRGMGLSALELNRDPVQTAELAGAMLREAVNGTMAVLMARAMTKRESRLDMTVLGAQANNPLKFFPDAESALAQMLTSAMGGYMPPVKAIGSAFDDLKAHELAVIAGMRAALNGVLARFDPAQIEAREPQGVMDKVMATARKARMWDSMVALYDDIVREADDDFQHLFGDKFSAAYEDQIGRLHRNP
jgi:type VI secretion system protein